MTMKSTWTLVASAVAALAAGSAIASLSAGSAVAASPTEREVPAIATHARHAAVAPDLRLAPRPLSVGDTAPADAVEAVRAEGMSVFVSPTGDGSGVVVDPSAPLPESVLAEIDAVNEPLSPVDVGRATAQLAARSALRAALDAAGTSVLVLYAIPTFDETGAVTGLRYGIVGGQDAPLEFATSRQLLLSPSRDHVVATWSPFLAAHPQYSLVDTTTP